MKPEIPQVAGTYQYRLVASIVMAEMARQVGQRPRVVAKKAERRRPRYDSRLEVVADESGEAVDLEELLLY